MKLGVPWSVKGIRPEARETARQAARHSGVPLGEWLNAVILQQAQQEGIDPYARAADDSYDQEFVTVHQRLDDLTRRIEQLTRSGPAAYAPRRKANAPEQASEPAGRLDRRLDQFSGAARQPAPPPPPRPASAVPGTKLPPALDRAVAEIAARRRVLNGEPAAPPLPQAVAPMAAPLPSQDLSGLEAQLRRITDQIETLRRPGVEEAINALRGELGEIGQALNEAMPRRAIDAIERQVAGLTQRIAEGRQAGVDQSALTGIERGLAEVRDALRGLTPAENLIGFNDAIASLAHKIDLIVAQKDPATLQQLESAITTLRGMAAHVASNDAVSQLAAEVQALGEKVEHAAQAAGGNDALNNLEHRIAAIADALAERAQTGNTMPPRLEVLVQSLTDKIEQIQSSRRDNVAMGHLEDRIVSLVQKLDASESRLGQLEAVERGLGDLLIHIEEMRAGRQAESLRADNAPGMDDLKHDIARTQDALEAVHGTLGHVVDRLAMIERDIRGEGRARPADAGVSMPAVGKLGVRAVNDAPVPPAEPAASPRMPKATPLALPAQPTTRETVPPPPAQAAPSPQAAPKRRAATSLPINPDLPPDQPLEPGSGQPKFGSRIAASEMALGGTGPAAAAGSKSSFIAAARRAAQTAMQQGAHAPMPRAETRPELEVGDEHSSLRSKMMKRVKSLFVAACIIAIVIGSVQIASNYVDLGGTFRPHTAKTGKAELSRTDAHKIAATVPEQAPMLAANPPAQTKLVTPSPHGSDTAQGMSSLLAPPMLGAPPPANDDITGSIPEAAANRHSGEPGPPPQADLPLAIGGARLRHAALADDADAEYEVAERFAEGRGVPVNLPAAAHWFARAARHGLAPAEFRYASMLEKGRGVEKDLDVARKLYVAAASKGHAKAMHNLAVLYAEGIDGKPDYVAAVKWFRQAAQHGIADSQYNLGVLCARGLGTKQSFAESYKWFALAATHGDQESSRKRDEVASHLDAATLAAAKREVADFKAVPPPLAANSVPKPRGGWDSAAGNPVPPAKPKAPATHRAPPQLEQHPPLSLGAFTVGAR
jgi:localization factor PodJL